MFEKVSQSAEKVVNKVSVSRRGFLGGVAKGAAALGAALAALAASPGEAGGIGWSGQYFCPDGSMLAKRGKGSECPGSVRHKGMSCICVSCQLW